MAQMKVEIEIPKEFSSDQREAIAEDVLQFIRDRSAAGLDKRNRKFKKYSKEYAAKKGVDPSDVDLVLDGDMMDELALLKHKPGKLVLGYEAGSDMNGQAEGNITGSYGKDKPNPKKSRDFLGITKADLANIVRSHKDD